MICIPISTRGVFDSKEISNAYFKKMSSSSRSCRSPTRSTQRNNNQSSNSNNNDDSSSMFGSSMVSVVATATGVGVGHGHGSISYTNNVDDFDRMCRELFWEVEQSLIMHKLAKDYFGFRAFWVQSLPLLIMTTFTAIIGFVQYGQSGGSRISIINEADNYNADQSRQRLALSVGTLGLLSTLLTCLTINTRYQSRRDMHAMAERTLAKVCQSVRFPERIPGDVDGTKLFEHLNKQRAIVVSIACMSSNVPPKIVQAFRDLKHVMEMKPYTFRAIQYERFYYFLWKLFMKRAVVRYFNFWPWMIPEIDISNNVLGKMIEDEFAKYNKGLEEGIRRGSFMSSKRRSSVMSRSSSNDDERASYEEERGLLASSATLSSATASEV